MEWIYIPTSYFMMVDSHAFCLISILVLTVMVIALMKVLYWLFRGQ